MSDKLRNELKPCPFCGCTEIRTSGKDDDPYVWCTNIRCAIYDIEIHVDKWNTRAGEAELVELLKRAKSIMKFHALRCPLDINNNYSGMEEHLAEYREVLELLKKHGEKYGRTQNESS